MASFRDGNHLCFLLWLLSLDYRSAFNKLYIADNKYFTFQTTIDITGAWGTIAFYFDAACVG